MLISMHSYAKNINIMENSTNINEEKIQNIAEIAKSMGVKEPMLIKQEQNNIKINSNVDKIECIFTLENEKIKSLKCK